MDEEIKSLQARITELEIQFHILSMAVVGDGDRPNPLGTLFLRKGLPARDFRQYYKFLDAVMDERGLDEILEMFLKYFPHRQPADLLEFGMAMYMNAPSGPLSRLLMEAALRGIRAQEPPMGDTLNG